MWGMTNESVILNNDWKKNHHKPANVQKATRPVIMRVILDEVFLHPPFIFVHAKHNQQFQRI